MKTAREWKPTQFDSTTTLPDGTTRRDWFVAPCGLNRDSNALEETNWETQLAALIDADRASVGHRSDPAVEDFEVHHYGHWACGWFEIVLVRPGSKCAEVAAELENRLQGYPALNESLWTEREHQRAYVSWCSQDVRDLLRDSVSARTYDALPYITPRTAYDVLDALRDNVEITNEHFSVYGESRDDIARVLRIVRKGAKS
jgi:hypothetical protein